MADGVYKQTISDKVSSAYVGCIHQSKILDGIADCYRRNKAVDFYNWPNFVSQTISFGKSLFVNDVVLGGGRSQGTLFLRLVFQGTRTANWSELDNAGPFDDMNLRVSHKEKVKLCIFPGTLFRTESTDLVRVISDMGKLWFCVFCLFQLELDSKQRTAVNHVWCHCRPASA